jgi:phosphoglycolate phosphatase-like HAD superfamily hydrolase
MKYLILFDIDGTILQMKQGISKKIFSDFLIELFGENINDAHIPTFHGMTDMQIIKEIAVNINYPFEQIEHNLNNIWKDFSRKFAAYCTKENIDLMPGIIELLETLRQDKRISLGLLTGNIKSNAYAKLDAFGLSGFFPVGAFGDDSYDRNALPEIAFARANDYYKGEKFDSAHSMLVGDSPRDIECGKTNNISVIAVATGWSSRRELEAENPDYIFDDFGNTEEVYNVIIKHIEENEKNNNSN